ncbi:FecR family protein [Pseudomonas chlororaphis]|uniref:Siderophore-interacting protein n=1 Tax=Pseudomonas chlororaphis TaxID=587753 RepID=A0A1Q8EJZ1_9PSED|nr:FecR domain-containing protein [Pseudomonas chlororaphis]OLF52112.1 siderophore-interacting protein [Pseudomonas chlororaphis]
MNSQGPQERSITEAAADWAVRLHAAGLSAAEQAELEQWLARDPRHPQALDFARQTWDALGELRLEPELAQPRRAPAAQAPVVRRPRRRRLLPRAASAAVLVLAVTLGWLQGPQALLWMQADYLTDKGQVRTVHLADGSTVELDSASAIRLDFNQTQRQVHLLAGSAVFDVAPMGGEESRPFVVESAGGQTRALGTRFVVGRESSQQAWVGVLQHSVAVSLDTPARQGVSERVLQEGQSARYDPLAGVVALEGLDLQRATSWRRGVLVFDRQPLALVVEQLNRYRPGRVVLADSTLAQRQVSGVFRLDMLDTALVTLTRELQVQHFDLAGVSLIY